VGAASTIGSIAKFIGKCLLAPVAVPMALLHTVVIGTAAALLHAADICWTVVRQKLWSTELRHDSFVKGIADTVSGAFFGGLKFFMSPYISTAKVAHQTFHNLTEEGRVESNANPYREDANQYSSAARQAGTQVSDPEAEPLFGRGHHYHR
jgi:hypothetical protein